MERMTDPICGMPVDPSTAFVVELEFMRHAIALSPSFCNTHRVLQQYVTGAYASW